MIGKVLIEKDRHYNNKMYGLGGFSFAKLTSKGIEYQDAEHEDTYGNTHWRTYKAYVKEPGLYIVDSYKYTTIYHVDENGKIEEVGYTKEDIPRTIETLKEKIEKYPEGKEYLNGVEERKKKNEDRKYIVDEDEKYVYIDKNKIYKIYKYRNGDKCIFLENQKIKIKDENMIKKKILSKIEFIDNEEISEKYDFEYEKYIEEKLGEGGRKNDK